MTEAFIYEAIRTPRGRGKSTGSLHGVKPVSLVTGLIDEMRTRHPDLDTDQVDDLTNLHRLVLQGAHGPVGGPRLLGGTDGESGQITDTSADFADR